MNTFRSYKYINTKRAQLKKNNKIFQAHGVEDNDQEEEERTKEDEDSCEEYVLISTLIVSVSPGNDTWLVDSGASRHMKGYKDSLFFLEHKDFPHKVILGDDYQYPIKGMGESSYKMDSKYSMKMKDVLYVQGLKKNSISISSLDKKCFHVNYDTKYLIIYITNHFQL